MNKDEIMSKEEILKRSRKEYEKQDELQNSIHAKAAGYACGAVWLVCGIVLCIEAAFSKELSSGIIAVLLSGFGTASFVYYVKMKKKSMLLFSILDFALTTALLVKYALELAV